MGRAALFDSGSAVGELAGTGICGRAFAHASLHVKGSTPRGSGTEGEHCNNGEPPGDCADMHAPSATVSWVPAAAPTSARAEAATVTCDSGAAAGPQPTAVSVSEIEDSKTSGKGSVAASTAQPAARHRRDHGAAPGNSKRRA